MMVLKNQAFVFVNMLCLLHTYRQIVYLLRSHKKTDALTRYHLSVFQMHSLAKVCVHACIAFFGKACPGSSQTSPSSTLLFLSGFLLYSRGMSKSSYIRPLAFAIPLLKCFPFSCVLCWLHTFHEVIKVKMK